MANRETKTDHQVARIIASQLGGFGKMKAMTGASCWVADEKSITFSFKGYRKANKCRVTLDASDTYTVEFFKFSRKYGTCAAVKMQSGVYCDSLIPCFEQSTGLYLSF